MSTATLSAKRGKTKRPILGLKKLRDEAGKEAEAILRNYTPEAIRALLMTGSTYKHRRSR